VSRSEVIRRPTAVCSPRTRTELARRAFPVVVLLDALPLTLDLLVLYTPLDLISKPIYTDSLNQKLVVPLYLRTVKHYPNTIFLGHIAVRT